MSCGFITVRVCIARAISAPLPEKNNKRTAEKSPEGLDYQWSMVCGPDRSYLWILSRTPTMAPETWKMLTDKARSVAPKLAET